MQRAVTPLHIVVSQKGINTLQGAPSICVTQQSYLELNNCCTDTYVVLLLTTPVFVALMSLLSMAHVTFGDAVGESNKTLLAQLAREDGMLLKADRPATAIDAQFQAMLFNAWPGQGEGPAPGHGNLFMSACDGNNPLQKFTYSGTATSPGIFKLAGVSSSAGCIDVSGCNHRVGSEVHVYNNTLGDCGVHSSCSGKNEQWTITENTDGPGGMLQYSIQSALTNSTTGSALCLETGVGTQLVKCDPLSASQGWVASGNRPGSKSFSLMATQHSRWAHDWCLTATMPTDDLSEQGSTGAFTFQSDRAAQSAVEELFPSSNASQLSGGYRMAYAQSFGLMNKIKQREHKQEQCGRGFGAPQGPLGEVYSTHVTIGNLTWRYVVGVQLSAEYNVSTHDLSMDSSEAYMSYKYDDATTFKPVSTADLVAGSKQSVLTLRKSDNSMCNTAPKFNITTRCFPFQWWAVAPRCANGWVLTGEVGKFMPISNQRIDTLDTLVGGGFLLSLKGKPGEVVTMGAVNVRTSGRVKYTSCTIGDDGTGILEIR